MKRLSVRLLVAILTFLAGVSAATVWLLHPGEPARVQPTTNVRAGDVKPAAPQAEPSPPRQKQTDEAEVRRMRALWESSGVSNYRFVLRASCLCSLSPRSPVAVEVRGGKPFSVKPLTESKYFYFYRQSYKDHDTVDKLFDAIEEAFGRRAEVVSASFDPARGFPTVINIDEDTKYVDDEVTIWVEQFEVIE